MYVCMYVSMYVYMQKLIYKMCRLYSERYGWMDGASERACKRNQILHTRTYAYTLAILARIPYIGIPIWRQVD